MFGSFVQNVLANKSTISASELLNTFFKVRRLFCYLAIVKVVILCLGRTALAKTSVCIAVVVGSPFCPFVSGSLCYRLGLFTTANGTSECLNALAFASRSYCCVDNFCMTKSINCDCFTAEFFATYWTVNYWFVRTCYCTCWFYSVFFNCCCWSMIFLCNCNCYINIFNNIIVICICWCICYFKCVYSCISYSCF